MVAIRNRFDAPFLISAVPYLLKQMEDPTVVTAEDDELTLDGNCYVKV